ncbi:hypothetical protein [Hyphomicrobium sp.]|uniref:hypothetical protein n=1 Tax=Hyphomicrobium sp. TaxID=82 RepID=UPI0013253FAE|nr:hypothetical protein [Hyphomicrobium sp.]KAB2936991.1 MAG: hypothetical protein F9K20_20685 [Hyphomicrobium sp.]
MPFVRNARWLLAGTLTLVAGFAVPWSQWTAIDAGPIFPAAVPKTLQTDSPGSNQGVEALDASVDSSVVTERPLFIATRRLPAKVAAAAPITAKSDLPAAQFKLIGVLVSGGTRQALLQGANAAEGRWYAEGAELGGWRIAAIGENSIVLAHGSRIVEVKLHSRTPEGWKRHAH